jgi:UDP-N-acetylglucosamine--dolichyl-phosphate N-acetylglucosaminephosphotransferase
VVAGVAFLLATFLLVPFASRLLSSTDDAAQQLEQLASFLSALLSLTSMIFLGFVDDVLDLPWRYKLLLPSMATIPLLVVYAVTYGVTHVVVPIPLRPWLGKILNLGAPSGIWIWALTRR